MRTISLRTLVRDPRSVKRMTRTGRPVQVTDNGEPLWTLYPVESLATDDAERRRAIEEIFQEVIQERPSRVSAALLLEESRR